MQPLPRRRWLAWMVMLLCCAAAWADPPGRVGRLAEVQGTVWLYDTEQAEWVAAERNRPITTGDRLSTDGDGRAELRVGSATLRLDADTQLDVTQLDDERLRFQLVQGAVAARLRNAEVAAEFELATAGGRFLPLRAGHYLIERDDGLDTATAWSGELRFDARDSALTVAAGQSAEFWQEAGVTHYAWASLEQDDFTQWAQRADRDDERQASRYVSPEMTGAEDLDRYGRWESHPEYGAAWIPAQVAPGWSPYRYGRWAWVRPWGWTWVDDAPWGFAPFHYGRWAWWHDRWCWLPGGYVARPVYAPALVGWVGSPSANLSVQVGSGPVVGWVPLAPRDVYQPWYPAPRHHWRSINPRTPDRFYRPGQPGGAVTYANRGVPGGVTVVPVDVLKARRPIGDVARSVDPRLGQRLVQQPALNVAPPAPAPSLAATRPAPGVQRGQVPPPPSVLRPAPGGPAMGAAPGARGPGERPSPPAIVDGRRGHGVIVAPGRPEVRPPAAMPAVPPHRVEPPRPMVPAAPPPTVTRMVPPPEVRRPPAQPPGRENWRPPQALGQPPHAPMQAPPTVMQPSPQGVVQAPRVMPPAQAVPRPMPVVPPPAAVPAPRAPEAPADGGPAGRMMPRPGGARQHVE